MGWKGVTWYLVLVGTVDKFQGLLVGHYLTGKWRELIPIGNPKDLFAQESISEWKGAGMVPLAGALCT